MLKPILVAALLCTVILAAPATAKPLHSKYKADLSAGGHTAPPGAIPVRPGAPAAPPGTVGRSPDLGVEPSPAQARAAKRAVERAAKEETFRDQHGHAIRLATNNDAVDLLPFAEILASTYHFDEISNVDVIVTSDAGVSQLCGPQAVACYAPDDPDRSNDGTMVLSYEDDDIVHTTFHEYGHHMDNQLYNLGERVGCRFDNDGSRRWFFARDVEDRILQRTTCSPDAEWSSLLGELYAEDYAQLSSATSGTRISGFDPRMPVPPPTGSVLAALKRDVDRPFVPRRRTLTGSFRRGKARRTLSLDAPAFVSVTGASEVRRASIAGCSTPYEDVYAGRCRLNLAKKGRARRYRISVTVF